VTSAGPADLGASRWLRPFIASVDVCAVAALVTGVLAGWSGSPQTFALLAALAALAGARPVRFARFKTELTATHPFVLLAVAVLGPAEAMLVGLVGLTGVLIRPGRPMRTDRTAFNLGAVCCAAAAAAWSFPRHGRAARRPLLAEPASLGLRDRRVLPGQHRPRHARDRSPATHLGARGLARELRVDRGALTSPASRSPPG
jgi:hypothetical protein